MDTGALKKFAQAARRQLIEQVAARMEQVLQTDSVEIREKEKAAKELREQINQSSMEDVIDQVAYTWFNRFCALRYMDVKHYTRIGIVSPVEGFTQPEILQESKQGVIDDSFKVDKHKVVGLLNGQLPSSNPQQEAYRLLLVGACNAYHAQMPFLFPKIDDYTELLMPDDLLSENSVLQAVRDTLTEEVCKDVEVIGWLYQYYISERKDEVFAALKKNKKIEAEDIPAATQLFTPHWIVRYLVENSLGRLWMLNHPSSKLVEQMDYYIRSEEPETDYLEISSPEEIKVCDPACGSGHMLTYSFDLLFSIYEEQGYDAVEIPSLILQHNLFGIEIDQRAGHLAAFALMMKAREKDRRLFNRGVEPNICVLENITFTASEIDAYKKAVGQDLFTQELWSLLQQFEQAENFGSLIRPQVQNPRQISERLQELGVFEDMFLRITSGKVKQILEFAEYLSPLYHVVVANPPYMGGKGMNAELKDFLKDQYPDEKSDTFSAFIIRNLELAQEKGQLGFMSPFVWMFISSYEKLRNFLIDNKTITSLIQLEYSGFKGATVPICTFTLENSRKSEFKGGYIRLSDFRGAINQAPKTLEAIQNPDCGWFFRTSAAVFKKIPGSPITYWLPQVVFNLWENSSPLETVVETRKGMCTRDNAYFVRRWHEVGTNKIGFGINNREHAKMSNYRWFPYQKGGEYRNWYGNHHSVVDWQNDGYRLLNMEKLGWPGNSTNHNLPYIFKPVVVWSKITSSKPDFRISPSGYLFDDASNFCYIKNPDDTELMLSYLCSKVGRLFVSIINPTLNLGPGNVASLPFIRITQDLDHVKKILAISKNDWDSLEISWDFVKVPLLDLSEFSGNMSSMYQTLRSNWQLATEEMKRFEEGNNRIFIEAYGLQDELIPEISIEDVTLTFNPHYRYDSKKTEEKLEALLLNDTMKEYISYAVGCMLGRYSLDQGGLILSNAGETLKDYLRQVPEPTFMPDADNVIPVLEGEWFGDDIAERFKNFLKITFGEEHYEENLAFLEEAIGRDIRSYFVKDFYSHHVKMYKKRPIYWLFSSPKGSFNALIYMHRYRPDTLSVILNDYLLQYRGKLTAHKSLLETRSISTSASQGEKTKALKEIDQINKVLSELKEYEDEILYPLATQQIEIDLDDGVKVNYKKFGKALKKVAGLSEKS